MRILYNSKDLYYKMPFGTLTEGQKCQLRIKIPVSCKTKIVKLIFVYEDMTKYAEFFMVKSETKEDYDVYSTSFSLAEPDLYFYYFRIETENEEFSLYKYGYSDTNIEEGELWQLSCIPSDFYVPQEFCGRVMYQIFPDRFYKSGDCDVSEKIKPFWIHENQKDTPCHLPNENGKVENCDFFGGNLRGIASKLDYLKKLGVGVIYLNPIFKAWSNHRYDTADYMKIDELLGTEADFAHLCKEAHNRDIKVILDGVFSHTGSNSIYFDKEKIFGNGAYSNLDSPYISWFDFEKYPDEYKSWWGIDTLPCVNENDLSYRDYIIESDDSVLSHWVRLGADGYRLDVADELPDEFIAEFRNKLKMENKNALLIGEVWEDASNKISYGKRRRYFTSGELDSVMNYPFRKAIIDYATEKDDGQGLSHCVMNIAENYPKNVLNTLMNMLSTHDTPRIVSLLSPSGIPVDKTVRANYKMSDEDFKVAFMRLKVATVLQFCLPGMPSVYYGDELGTEGFEDPFCRTFFDWEKVDNNKVYEFFYELANIRNKSDVLKFGDIEAKCIKNGVVVLERCYNNSSLRLVVNTADDVMCYSGYGKCVYSERTKENDEGYIIEKFGFVIEQA